MSYILEALKRAEQERQIGQAPNAAVAPAGDDYADEPRRWPWLLLAMMLLALLAAGAAYWLASQAPGVASVESVDETKARELASESAPGSSPSVELALPTRVTAVTTTPLVIESDATSSNVEPAPVLAEPQHAKQPEPTVAEASAAQSAIVENEPAASSQSPESAVASAPPAIEEEEDPSYALPWLREMSEDYRRSVPSFDIQFHRYSDNRYRSFVMVDGARYREGQILKAGPIVERIVEEGLILRWQGERFVYPLGG